MKKIIGFLMTLLVFFAFSGAVQARMLTSTEVFNDFKTTFIDPMNSHGGKLTVSNDTTNKKYTVYSDSIPLATFDYTDSYVEYDHRTVEITQENLEKELGAMFCYDAMVNSILKLSGYEDKTIRSDEFPELEDTFDQYGYQVDFEHHDFQGNDMSVSGEFVKYFKMSFDTAKIDILMNRYGIDKEEYEEIINNNNNNNNNDNENNNNNGNNNNDYDSDDENMNEILRTMVTTLEVQNITSNSVTLKPSVIFSTTKDDFKIYCDIYRSTTKEGTYEKLTKEPINCFNKDSYTDSGLKSNTTYYYKTKIVQSNKYSEVYSITTKATDAAAASSANKGDTVKNPETGVVTYTVASLAVIIASVVALLYTRKKSVFKNL